MSLEEFHHSFRALVHGTIAERVQANEGPFPSEELVFAELVMEHVANAGICEPATICHWSGTVQGKIRITGYALSSDETRLDLFVTHYLGSEEISPVGDPVVGSVAAEGVRFLFHASNGKLLGKVEPSHDVHGLISTVANLWADLDQLRVFVITDGKAKGTTPAQKKIADSIPTRRKLSKNDVAKYHEAWRGKPAQVALAGEKNFAAFMAAFDDGSAIVPEPLDAAWYRAMIAKIIVTKTVEAMIKTKEAKTVFRQGYANIATYTASVVSERLGDRIDFELIWKRQRVSNEFQRLLYDWATEVNRIFEQVAPGRQISEVAKRPEIWPKVRAGTYSSQGGDIPELGG